MDTRYPLTLPATVVLGFAESLGAISHTLCGGIAAVGDSSNEDSRFTLAHLNSDGALDLSFGDAHPTNGERLGFTTVRFPAPWHEGIFLADSVLPQACGRYFVSGVLLTDRFLPAAARFLADGSLDPAFGDNGLLVIDYLPQPASATPLCHEDRMACQAQAANVSASVAVQGASLAGDGGYLICSEETGYLIRLTATGQPETQFAGCGYLHPHPEGLDSFELSNAVYQGEQLVVAGNHGSDTGVLARYTASGKQDLSFGEDHGMTLLEVPGAALTKVLNVTTSTDGALTVVGFSQHDTRYFGLLMRLRANGQLQPSFNLGRPVLFAPHDRGCDFRFVAIDACGGHERIYVAGQSTEGFSDVRYVLAAFTPKGTLACGFAPNGYQLSHTATSAGTLLLERGRLVVGGRTAAAGEYRAMLGVVPL